MAMRCWATSCECAAFETNPFSPSKCKACLHVLAHHGVTQPAALAAKQAPPQTPTPAPVAQPAVKSQPPARAATTTTTPGTQSGRFHSASNPPAPAAGTSSAPARKALPATPAKGSPQTTSGSLSTGTASVTSAAASSGSSSSLGTTSHSAKKEKEKKDKKEKKEREKKERERLKKEEKEKKEKEREAPKEKKEIHSKEKEKETSFLSLLGSKKKPVVKEQPSMVITGPTLVKHEGHIGFNKQGGFELKNLPPDMAKILMMLNEMDRQRGGRGLTKKEAMFLLNKAAELTLVKRNNDKITEAKGASPSTSHNAIISDPKLVSINLQTVPSTTSTTMPATTSTTTTVTTPTATPTKSPLPTPPKSLPPS
eukprot:TRINITY_DN6466_c0_g1_i1.p1 TRINITY_DN6466_c0_g1~~TRINITY_DN6466_c0_g1_i1.p1  ORF type:complete len:368 (-),score=129.15 TRINITY_DN6466_c0_g1_i1:54-1157(-)